MVLFVRHHPDYTWPDAQETDGNFIYTATALSHPLMRRGIAQNMNACFLMQQMGIGEGEW